MAYYIGNTPDNVLPESFPRYYYALRRTDDGELYFIRLDQLTDKTEIPINIPADPADDYTDFEIGVDFFDGRDEVDHTRPYPNLIADQWRWDERYINYYINDNGELIARINQQYTFSEQDNITYDSSNVSSIIYVNIREDAAGLIHDGVFYLDINEEDKRRVELETPVLTFEKNRRYIFDQNDQFNWVFQGMTHPLRFATAADAAGNTEYEVNVAYKLNGIRVSAEVYTNPTLFASASDRRVEIYIDDSTPAELYYYCDSHAQAGNRINVV